MPDGLLLDGLLDEPLSDEPLPDMPPPERCADASAETEDDDHSSDDRILHRDPPDGDEIEQSTSRQAIWHAGTTWKRLRSPRRKLEG